MVLFNRTSFTVRNFLLLFIGLFFTVSHVCSIPVGINLKIPEILILLFCFYTLLTTPPPAHGFRAIILSLLFLALIVFPFFSNIIAFTLGDQARLGSQLMGGANILSRESHISSPWIMLGWNLISFCTFYTFSGLSRTEINLILKAVCISTFVLSLYAIASAILVNSQGFPDIPWPTDTRHMYQSQLRAQGFFIEPLNLAHYLACVSTLSLVVRNLFSTRLTRFLICDCGLVLSYIAFFLTFSTSGFVALICALLVTAWASEKVSKKNVILLVMGIMLIAILAFIIPATRTAFIDKIIYTLFIQDIQVVGPSLIDRIWKNSSGLDVFYDYPLFGAGLGSSGLLYPFYSAPEAPLPMDGLAFPLNEYIRMLAETGLIGVIVFGAFAATYAIYLSKKERNFSKSEFFLFFGGWIATLVAFNFSSLFNVYFIWALAGIGLSIALGNRNPHLTATSQVRRN